MHRRRAAIILFAVGALVLSALPLSAQQAGVTVEAWRGVPEQVRVLFEEAVATSVPLMESHLNLALRGVKVRYVLFTDKAATQEGYQALLNIPPTRSEALLWSTGRALVDRSGNYIKVLKPLHADYIQFIKERTPARLFFHSDGDVFDLIPDLIEIGVDILNPMQTSAGKMADLSELKRRFGDRLVFCGAIDTQRILPYGTPDKVRQEVRRVIGLLGPGGGYMVAPVHTIMSDVPPENILAMVDAVEVFGRYPLLG